MMAMRRALSARMSLQIRDGDGSAPCIRLDLVALQAGEARRRISRMASAWRSDRPNWAMRPALAACAVVGGADELDRSRRYGPARCGGLRGCGRAPPPWPARSRVRRSTTSWRCSGSRWHLAQVKGARPAVPPAGQVVDGEGLLQWVCL